MKKKYSCSSKTYQTICELFLFKGKKNNFRRNMYSYAHTDNVLFNINTEKDYLYLFKLTIDGKAF